MTMEESGNKKKRASFVPLLTHATQPSYKIAKRISAVVSLVTHVRLSFTLLNRVNEQSDETSGKGLLSELGVGSDYGMQGSSS